MRKIISILVASALLCAMSVPVFADTDTTVSTAPTSYGQFCMGRQSNGRGRNKWNCQYTAEKPRPCLEMTEDERLQYIEERQQQRMLNVENARQQKLKSQN